MGSKVKVIDSVFQKCSLLTEAYQSMMCRQRPSGSTSALIDKCLNQQHNRQQVWSMGTTPWCGWWGYVRWSHHYGADVFGWLTFSWSLEDESSVSWLVAMWPRSKHSISKLQLHHSLVAWMQWRHDEDTDVAVSWLSVTLNLINVCNQLPVYQIC